MEKRLEKVAGGFHAIDADLGVTVFGRTETDALQALEESRKRAMRLDLLVIAQGGIPRPARKQSLTHDAEKEEKPQNDKAG